MAPARARDDETSEPSAAAQAALATMADVADGAVGVWLDTDGKAHWGTLDEEGKPKGGGSQAYDTALEAQEAAQAKHPEAEIITTFQSFA